MSGSRDRAAQHDARQIVRIVRIECDQPLERVNALVFGQSPCAEPLAGELREAGARVTQCGDPPGEPGEEERFDLILLLECIGADQLGALALPGALVVDACKEKNSEWVIYDSALHYRRIRVISTPGL